MGESERGAVTRPTLLVMAAGMGRRYGGDKQVERLGPDGERLFEYALFDAHRAGFDRAVFITRPALDEEILSMRQVVPGGFGIDVVHQHQHDVPPGPWTTDRSKPWGTGHAVLAARDLVRTPFVVINADDFYGAQAYAIATEACAAAEASGDYAMVGLRLDATLPSEGKVVRGIPRVEDGVLVSLDEMRDIERTPEGVRGRAGAGTRNLTGAEIASMNFWVFTPSVFDHLSTRFRRFLERHAHDPGAEFLLPEVASDLVQEGAARVRVFQAPGPWFGLTNPADREKVVAGLAALARQGVYPRPLWS